MHSDQDADNGGAKDHQSDKVAAGAQEQKPVGPDAPREHENHASDNDTNPPAQKPGPIDLPTSFDVIAGIAAVAAVVGTVFTGCQLTLTRETFEIGQRAWVTATTARIDPLPLKEDSRFAVRMMNNGQSPALRFKTIELDWSMSEPCGEHAHPPLSEDDLPSQSESVLGPGDDAIQGLVLGISEPAIASVANDGGRIHYFGGIEYYDILKTRHVTRFCLVYGHGTKEIPKFDPDDPPIGACRCHNEAD